MSARPTVSIVVPFGGTAAELPPLFGSLSALQLQDGDELILADNHRRSAAAVDDLAGGSRVRVVPAHGLRTPAFARNRGALTASGEWLIFIDADARPEPDLVAEYFEPLPRPSTAVLAGAIRDVAGEPTLVARHRVARGHLSQGVTMGRAQRPYAQTANCAVRRSAFEAVGGFAAWARAGEDADLCFRLQDAGWELEERPAAVVEHRSRETLPSVMLQLARHGSGAAWVNRRYPGSFPPPTAFQFARRLVGGGREVTRATIRRDEEAASFGLLDLAGACAFEFGRRLPNRRRGWPRLADLAGG
jgi:cellulose synthase/poly-beta-1,6-N-acetylglucosamine synthase-like glycosyltransferase